MRRSSPLDIFYSTKIQFFVRLGEVSALEDVSALKNAHLKEVPLRLFLRTWNSKFTLFALCRYKRCVKINISIILYTFLEKKIWYKYVYFSIYNFYFHSFFIGLAFIWSRLLFLSVSTTFVGCCCWNRHPTYGRRLSWGYII